MKVSKKILSVALGWILVISVGCSKDTKSSEAPKEALPKHEFAGDWLINGEDSVAVNTESLDSINVSDAGELTVSEESCLVLCTVVDVDDTLEEVTTYLIDAKKITEEEGEQFIATQKEALYKSLEGNVVDKNTIDYTDEVILRTSQLEKNIYELFLENGIAEDEAKAVVDDLEINKELEQVKQNSKYIMTIKTIDPSTSQLMVGDDVVTYLKRYNTQDLAKRKETANIEQLAAAAEEAANNAASDMKDAADQAQASAEDAAAEVEEAVNNAASDVEDAVDQAQEGAENAAAEAEEGANSAASDVKDAVAKAQEGAEDTAAEVKEGADSAASDATDAVAKAQEGAKDATAEAEKGAKTAASDAEDAANEAADKAQEGTEDVTAEAEEGAKTAASDAEDAANEAADKAQEGTEDATAEAEKGAKTAASDAEDAANEAAK